MPKRVSEESKRVPLNCLVLPETLAWLKTAIGSQGATVDRAVSALQMQIAAELTDATLRLADRPFLPETFDGPVVTRDVSRVPKLNKPKPFKGPLLKPKDRK